MAKNYTFAEAVEIINAGTDMESIADIGRRFPNLLHKVTKVVTKAGDDFVDLMSYLPDHLTANKVNTSIKNSIGSDGNEDTDGDEEVEEEVKEVKAEKATKSAKAEKAEATGTDYESMSGKELWELLGKFGKRKDCKEKMGGAKKDDMIAYINKYGLEDTKAEEAEEAEEETTEATNPYEGKSAMELYKECKKRGVKAEAKKPAKYYAELLTKADAEATEESDSNDDDWGDEAEEPKTEKAEKKAPKKSEKKAPKKEEAKDDDDDDWDI